MISPLIGWAGAACMSLAPFVIDTDAGTISDQDLALFRYVETAEEAMEALANWENVGQKRGSIPGR